jgi:Mg/Co/Ni transporter MgtE
MTLKPAKGETSAGLIIGLVLLVAIIIGLIVWSQSNKTPSVDESSNVPVTITTDTPSSTGTNSTTAPTTTTTTTTTVQTTPANPTLPQTGFGPEGK